MKSPPRFLLFIPANALSHSYLNATMGGSEAALLAG